jgi:hypothetical protein
LRTNERIVDLLPIARRYYYYPSQCGSWALKWVLPTIVADIGYDKLTGVHDGNVGGGGTSLGPRYMVGLGLRRPAMEHLDCKRNDWPYPKPTQRGSRGFTGRADGPSTLEWIETIYNTEGILSEEFFQRGVCPIDRLIG